MSGVMNYLQNQDLRLHQLSVNNDMDTVIADLETKSDHTLFKLIAQNTENLHELGKELRLAEGADNIQKLAAAIASLADAQSKLVAIAQTQEPNCTRILDYAEHLTNDQESIL